jgi:hypothetical protein
VILLAPGFSPVLLWRDNNCRFLTAFHPSQAAETSETSWLAAQMDEESSGMALVLVCKKCRQREILPVR